MKFGKLLLALIFIGSLFFYSCRPDKIEPNPSPEMGAFDLLPNPPGNEHLPPDPKCGPELTGQLYISAYGQVFPLNGTEYFMVNGFDNLYINIKGLPGWVFYESACHIGPVGTTPPINPNTNQTDISQFTFYKDHIADNSLLNKKTWRIDISSIEQIQTYSVAAVLGRWDFTNNTPIGAPFTVWINGKPIQGPGGFTLDYQLESCPSQSCQPWLNAAIPCNPPCDTTWAQNSGYNPGIGAGSGSGSSNSGSGSQNGSSSSNGSGFGSGASSGSGSGLGSGSNNSSNSGSGSGSGSGSSDDGGSGSGSGSGSGFSSGSNSGSGSGSGSGSSNGSNSGSGSGNGGNNQPICNNNILVGFDNCEGTVIIESNKRLKKVTLLFDDCSMETFDTKKKTMAILEGTGMNDGKEILGAFVKNACYSECGLGEYISKDGSSFASTGCVCNAPNSSGSGSGSGSGSSSGSSSGSGSGSGSGWGSASGSSSGSGSGPGSSD